MNDAEGYRSRLRGYLLQQSNPEERQRLEAELFEDDDLFALLIQTEEALVEGFEEGRLSTHDERAFREAMAQSPRLGELLALHRHTMPKQVVEKPSRPWLYYTIGVFVLVTFASWLSYHSWSNSHRREPIWARVTLAPPRVTAQLKPPGVREGGSSTGITIKVTRTIKELVLQFPPESLGSGPFTASIRNVDSPATLWQGNVLVDDKHIAFVEVPNFSTNDDYILTVSSDREAVAAFYFRLRISD